MSTRLPPMTKVNAKAHARDEAAHIVFQFTFAS